MSADFKKPFGIPEHLTPVFSDALTKRAQINKTSMQAIKDSFPIDAGKYSLHLGDMELKEDEVTPTMQKEAIFKRKSLHNKVYGQLVLKDLEGKVLEKKKQLLMKLPYLNDDHAFVVDGNPYTVRNLIRTRPGVYTRKRGND